MKQEEKRLLLKDLCARLPYGVNVNIELIHSSVPKYDSLLWGFLLSDNLAITQKDGYTKFFNITDAKIKPYLRPMSSMTEEEKEELYQKTGFRIDDCILGLSAIDWLNTHHFDFRNLIEKGLAIEAPEGMYK